MAVPNPLLYVWKTRLRKPKDLPWKSNSFCLFRQWKPQHLRRKSNSFCLFRRWKSKICLKSQIVFVFSGNECRRFASKVKFFVFSGDKSQKGKDVARKSNCFCLFRRWKLKICLKSRISFVFSGDGGWKDFSTGKYKWTKEAGRSKGKYGPDADHTLKNKTVNTFSGHRHSLVNPLYIFRSM